MAEDKTPNNKAPEIQRAQTYTEFSEDPRVIEILKKRSLTKEEAHYLMARIPTEQKESVKALAQYFVELMALEKELEDLKPYLDKELKKPQYNGKSVEQLREEAEEAAANQYYNSKADPAAPLPPEVLDAQQKEAAAVELWQQLLTAARTASEQQPLRVRYNEITEIKASTDKLPTLFYSPFAPPSKHHISGQREMLSIPKEEMHQLKYERSGKPKKGEIKEITLFYDFFPNESQLAKLGLTDRFDSYDYFVSTILDALFLEDNKVVSLTKIWHELGYKGSPDGGEDGGLTDLYKRLVRGATTIVTIDDGQVQAAWGNRNSNEKYNEIISPLMPLQIYGERFIANGNVAKAQIHITGLSPFFALSKSIGHFTTWKKEVLQLYTGKKTQRYYDVLRFLMTQIAWIRNPNSNRSNKITYKDLYNHTGDTKSRGKQLARDMMYRLFDEVFIPTGYVKRYEEDTKGEPGVLLYCTKNTAALQTPKATAPTKTKKQ